MRFKQVQLAIPPQIFIEKEELQSQNNKDDLLAIEGFQDQFKMLKNLQKIDIYEDQQTLHDLIKFYINEMHSQKELLQQNESKVLPILCIKHRQKHKFKILTILCSKQGILLSDLLDFQVNKFEKQLVKQFNNIIKYLCQIKFYPILSPQNIYLKQFQSEIKIQIFPSQNSIDQRHFVEKLKIILIKIIKSQKNIKQILQNSNFCSITQVIKLCQTIIYKNQGKQNLKKQVQEKYSIKNIFHQWQFFQKKHQNLNSFKKIQISEKKWSQIEKCFEIQIKSKQFLLSGKDIKFDPSVLHKKIQNKGPLLYVIQDQFQNKIAFLTYLKLPKKFQPLFGTYFNDQQQKCAIYDFKSSQIFKAKDKNYSLGYGPQIFLAIGKLDIIISAFNINNFCFFPYTYALQKMKKQQMNQDKNLLQFQIVQKEQEQEIQLQQKARIFDKQFIVKNLDIYHLTIIQKQKSTKKYEVNKKQEKKNPIIKEKLDAKQRQKLNETPIKKQKTDKSKEKSLVKGNLDKTNKK